MSKFGKDSNVDLPTVFQPVLLKVNAYTVHPVFKDHPWEEKNLVFVHRTGGL